MEPEHADEWKTERDLLGLLSDDFEAAPNPFASKVTELGSIVACSRLVAVLGSGACGKTKLVDSAAEMQKAVVHRLDANAFSIVGSFTVE
jgi:ABC-type taurine transport system ATPase subunit